jgi:hypothetical protein
MEALSERIRKAAGDLGQQHGYAYAEAFKHIKLG